MAFTTNMSSTTELADSVKQLYSDQFFISAEQGLTVGLDSTVTVQEEIDAKNINFTTYSKLTVQTSALDHDDDVTSEAMSDSLTTLTPAEYGNVVTITSIADLQAGGMASQGAFRLAGINARESAEKLLILAGEASTNELIVTQASEASLTASDVLTAAYVQRAYNKLRRVGIPGPYWAVAHDDVIHDLKVQALADAPTWTHVNQYQNSVEIKENEVGKFGGFRWISHPQVTINADAGSGTVDTYHTLFYGFNAFGKAVSLPSEPRITGPFDKLARFSNIGWYGVYTYGIVDQNALWVVTSASSIGAN